MEVHLVDGTYELFRHFHAVPSRRNDAGEEVGATIGVLQSMVTLLRDGATHVGVATDHVIESFRNDLWPGYKSSAGVPAELLSQFQLLEDALEAMGLVVWPMVELEADDALAASAASTAADPGVDRVLICTPDKDVAQCVVERRVVVLDRRKKAILDEDGVVARFGVAPESIPDYLALVGDSADGYPGLPGWGAKSAAAVLGRYRHLEDIPVHPWRWDVDARGATRLAAALDEQRELAFLFRDLATLRRNDPVIDDVGALQWRGPAATFDDVCARLGSRSLPERVGTLAARR